MTKCQFTRSEKTVTNGASPESFTRAQGQKQRQRRKVEQHMQADTKARKRNRQLRKLKCVILGHKWESIGYNEYASPYAYRCERCRKIDIRIEGL